MLRKITGLLLIALVVLPVIDVPVSSSLQGYFENPSQSFFRERKPVVKVAIIRQYWDPLDVLFTAKISTLIHVLCLKKAEIRYNVRFRIFEFWDNWLIGDVQSGLLQLGDIDVIIAPGGVGGWYTPLPYRFQIKQFVRSGGGFYGICGDSTFGSLGVKGMKWQYKPLISRLLGYEDLSPMLRLVDVYTDASAFLDVIKFPLFFNRVSALNRLSQLPESRAEIYFEKNTLPIQKPYMGKTLIGMLGNAPMVDGPVLFDVFMPKVYTVATIKTAASPYGERIIGKKAIVASTYGKGRVVLSCIHSELTLGSKQMQDVYVRNVLWLAKQLGNSKKTRFSS